MKLIESTAGKLAFQVSFNVVEMIAFVLLSNSLAMFCYAGQAEYLL